MKDGGQALLIWESWVALPGMWAGRVTVAEWEGQCLPVMRYKYDSEVQSRIVESWLPAYPMLLPADCLTRVS